MSDKSLFRELELKSFIKYVRDNPDIPEEKCKENWDQYYINIIDKDFVNDCNNTDLIEIEDKDSGIKLSLFQGVIVDVYTKYVFGSSGFHFYNYSTWRGFLRCSKGNLFDHFKQHEKFKAVMYYDYNINKTNQIKIFYINPKLKDNDDDGYSYQETIGEYKIKSNWVEISSSEHREFVIFFRTDDTQVDLNLLNIIKSKIRKRKLKKVLENE